MKYIPLEKAEVGILNSEAGYKIVVLNTSLPKTSMIFISCRSSEQ
jgi:hypothetical protein